MILWWMLPPPPPPLQDEEGIPFVSRSLSVMCPSVTLPWTGHWCSSKYTYCPHSSPRLFPPFVIIVDFATFFPPASAFATSYPGREWKPPRLRKFIKIMSYGQEKKGNGNPTITRRPPGDYVGEGCLERNKCVAARVSILRIIAARRMRCDSMGDGDVRHLLK